MIYCTLSKKGGSLRRSTTQQSGVKLLNVKADINNINNKMQHV
jgi:hypothetical protein